MIEFELTSLMEKLGIPIGGLTYRQKKEKFLLFALPRYAPWMAIPETASSLSKQDEAWLNTTVQCFVGFAQKEIEQTEDKKIELRKTRRPEAKFIAYSKVAALKEQGLDQKKAAQRALPYLTPDSAAVKISGVNKMVQKIEERRTLGFKVERLTELFEKFKSDPQAVAIWQAFNQADLKYKETGNDEFLSVIDGIFNLDHPFAKSLRLLFIPSADAYRIYGNYFSKVESAMTAEEYEAAVEQSLSQLEQAGLYRR